MPTLWQRPYGPVAASAAHGGRIPAFASRALDQRPLISRVEDAESQIGQSCPSVHPSIHSEILRWAMSEQNLHVEREQRVTPLELFFDLVFVFAFTQVTTVLSSNPTWSGLGHALLILVALWWAWAAYAWLTNVADPNEGRVWGTMLVAMAAMFVAALAVPDAFGRHGVVFGVAFLVVAVMQLALYALLARGDRDLVRAIMRIAPSTVAGAALIVAAGFVHGGLKPLLWLVALVVGFFGLLFVGLSGWRVHPAHFVERHGLT
jgi:low temperature requirement protein LtrA